MLRKGLVLTAIAVAALLGPAGPALALPSVRAGSLSVQVSTDPVSIEFRDRASGRSLRTVAEPGGLGPLGYSFDLRIPLINNAFLGYYAAAETPIVSFHATRVISAVRRRGGLDLDLATNDPLGHRLLATIRPTSDGVASLDSRIAPGSGPLAGRAGTSGARFVKEKGERFLGFGERSNAVDQTGNRVFSWAEEGPFSSGIAEPVLRPLIPDFTFPTGPTATNFPVPWALSTRGLGLLIDQPERSTFRLGTDDPGAWQAEAEAGHFRATVFAGPKPAAVLRRYSAYAGRQPDPAPWIFGPWFQPTLEARKYELADRFRKDDVPATVAQTYTHYLPCGAQVGKRAGQRDQTREYHRRGYKVTTYVNPHICTTYQPVYDQAAERGYLVKNARGAPYKLSNPFTADEQVSEVDFTHPGAVRFWQKLLDEAIADGYDGWMEDFGEYTPTDAVFSNGQDGLAMHNRYPVLYHRASQRLTRRRMGRDAAVFVRSGFHGVQKYARIVWGGDPTEDFSCSDGLCAAVHQALSIGLTGVAYWGSDIGGFHAVANPRTSDELNIRWLQFGAVSGVMRTQANGLSLISSRADRSQVWSPDVYPVWRRYAKLRTQLLPYLEAASRDYQRTGMPIMRQLALAYPDDRQAVRSQTEFLFGPDLFAAPVTRSGARTRSFHLPAGRWVDLWRSLEYRRGPGSFEPIRPRVIRGGGEVTLPAPLDELPLLARAGTLLPLLPPDVDTLADVGRQRGLVRLDDRLGELRLLAWPRGRSSASLADGVTATSSEKTGRMWRLRIGAGDLRIRLAASLATLEQPFRPCAVEVDGDRLGGWRYDKSVLSARLPRGARSVQVRACG